MASIIVDKLYKKFDIKNGNSSRISALDDISFNIAEGEKVGIIGLNGSGKTTLLRLIGGIYQQDSGSIVTNGELISINDYSWAKMRLTVRDNIYLGGALYGLFAHEIKKIIPSILEFAELEKYIDSPCHILSFGMLERLSISVSLYLASSKQAKILLIDELFSNSDINFTVKAIRKLEELNKLQATILMTSHNLEAIIDKCDRIIWLDKGKIVKIGRSAQIISEFMGANLEANKGVKVR